jgi:hypothetical protein
VELLAQGLVLDGVPAQAHAQPEPAPGQQVDLDRLLGHEHGLALGQDDDAGHQLERDQRGQVAEQHERLVERGVRVVGPVPAGVDGGVGAHHVVVGQHVRVAQLGDGLAVRPHGRHVATQLGLREHGSDPHGEHSVFAGARPCAPAKAERGNPLAGAGWPGDDDSVRGVVFAVELSIQQSLDQLVALAVALDGERT